MFGEKTIISLLEKLSYSWKNDIIRRLENLPYNEKNLQSAYEYYKKERDKTIGTGTLKIFKGGQVEMETFGNLDRMFINEINRLKISKKSLLEKLNAFLNLNQPWVKDIINEIQSDPWTAESLQKIFWKFQRTGEKSAKSTEQVKLFFEIEKLFNDEITELRQEEEFELVN